jgi:hypothetical protein
MDPRQLLQRIFVSGLLLYLGAALIVDPAGLIGKLRSISLDVEEAMVRFRQQLQGTPLRDRAWRSYRAAERPSRWWRVLGIAAVLAGLILICTVPHA